jgi:hypothetical protein
VQPGADLAAIEQPLLIQQHVAVRPVVEHDRDHAEVVLDCPPWS